MLDSIHSPIGPSMYGINCLLIVCMVVENRMHAYLVTAGYTSNKGRLRLVRRV